MISCVICSRNTNISKQLHNNISETIGCPYELIVVDNSKNNYTIFSAYNEGVRRAKGDVLCFMHEDILYHSRNWGVEVMNVFRDESIGLIGVLGTQFMPRTLSAWWWRGCTVGAVMQSRGNRLGMNDTFINGNPQKSNVDAVIVDGLWYCIRKNLFEHISYDIHTYSGFHGYDHDICMQVLSAGKRVVVVSNIVIEHASEGNVGKAFLGQLQLFYNKWETFFPLSRGMQLDDETILRMEKIIKLLEEQVRKNVMIKESRKYRYVEAVLNFLYKFKIFK